MRCCYWGIFAPCVLPGLGIAPVKFRDTWVRVASCSIAPRAAVGAALLTGGRGAKAQPLGSRQGDMDPWGRRNWRCAAAGLMPVTRAVRVRLRGSVARWRRLGRCIQLA